MRLHSLISALILTYALSRLSFRALPFLGGYARLVVAHLLSFLLLALAVGLAKAYFNSFAGSQTLVLLPAALFWLVVDLLRGKHLTGVAPSRRR